MKQLIARLRELEVKEYDDALPTNSAGVIRLRKDFMQDVLEVYEALPQLLDRLEKLERVVEAAKDACRSIPGMLPKIEDALAALEKP